MSDLIVSFITITPRPTQSGTASPPHSSGGGSDAFSGKIPEVQQGQIQIPGMGK